jgi:serine/threonine protein kinase
MRYMPGGTLAERISGQPMPLAEIIPIVQRLAEALDEAHSHEVVHRDLKPSNVMFDGKGNAFLSDFGIAKMLESSTLLTATGVMGTPAYMSPEQAMGADLDGRSDVYSLGVILYEMLTGQQPYAGKSPAALMMQHVTGQAPPINAQTLGLPARCNNILARALAKEPATRYQTAWELAEAVNTLGTESGVPVPSRSRPPPGVQRPSFRPRPANADTGTSVGTKVIHSLASQPQTKARPKSWYQQLSRRGWVALIAVLGVLAATPVFALAVMAGDGFGRRTPTPTPTAPPTATPAPRPTLAPTAVLPTWTPVVVTVIATVPMATAIPSETPTDTPIPPTATAIFVPTTRRPPPTNTFSPPTPSEPPPPSPTGTPTSTNLPPPQPPDTPEPPPKTPTPIAP